MLGPLERLLLVDRRAVALSTEKVIFMGPIDILISEHALVVAGLDTLDRAVRARGPAMGRLLDFFDEFLDRHHHTKEEDELFPAMIAEGFPSRGGPITVMLGEHDRGRSLVAAMRGALADGADERFADLARSFSALLRDHIQKENHVLFPMAMRAVSPAKLEALGERWEATAGVTSRWRDDLASIDGLLTKEHAHA
jgi:hemerythrin-like domain-containing protein